MPGCSQEKGNKTICREQREACLFYRKQGTVGRKILIQSVVKVLRPSYTTSGQSPLGVQCNFSGVSRCTQMSWYLQNSLSCLTFFPTSCLLVSSLLRERQVDWGLGKSGSITALQFGRFHQVLKLKSKYSLPTNEGAVNLIQLIKCLKYWQLLCFHRKVSWRIFGYCFHMTHRIGNT